MPVKVIKGNINIVIYFVFVYTNFNNSFFSLHFPSNLKKADITLTLADITAENYHPVSILLILSKVFERCMYNQIYESLNKVRSKWQWGFRQGYTTQYCVLVIIEKWCKCFFCLLYGFLISILATYGFD